MTDQPRPDLPVRPGFGREDWNRRYASDALLWSADPNRCFVSEVGVLEPGKALDLGCGEGRNAVWLAERGWEVTGLDFSDVALEKAQRLATDRGVEIEWVLEDAQAYRPPPVFDLVALLYLHVPAEERRLVVRNSCQALVPGGVLFVLGHDITNLTAGYGGPKDASVLFGPDDVVAELEGCVVERAERIRRIVTSEDGEAVAIDAVLRARRAPRE